MIISRLAELSRQDPVPVERVLRANQVLKTFVLSHESCGIGATLKVNMRLFVKGGPRLTLRASMHDTGSFLRDRLSERIHKPSGAIRLLDETGCVRRETDLLCTLEQLGIDGEAPVYFDLCPTYQDTEPVRDSLEDDAGLDSGDLPSCIVANSSDFFEQLWSLLSLGGEVAAEIWQLVSILPTNQQFASKVTELRGDTVWPDVLDPTSSYRLEYGLRVIKIIAFGTESETAEERANWCKRFEQLGGVRHIYCLFFEQDMEYIRQHLLPSCVASLLEVLGFFLLVEIRSPLSGSGLALSSSAESAHQLAQSADPLQGLRDSHLALRDSSTGDEPAKLDFSLIATQLVLVIESAVKATAAEPNPEEGELVRNAARLLFATLSSRPENLDKLLLFPRLPQLLAAALLNTQEEQIRFVMAAGLRDLIVGEVRSSSETNTKCRKALVPLLFGFMSTVEAPCSTCCEYFSMLQELLWQHFQSQGPLSPSDETEKGVAAGSLDLTELLSLTSLMEECAVMLVDHPCIEGSYSGTVDEKLVGILGIAEVGIFSQLVCLIAYISHIADIQ